MRTLTKDPDAISRLSPEQGSVAQHGGTEAPGPGNIWIARQIALLHQLSLRFIHRDEMEAVAYRACLNQRRMSDD